MVKNIYKKNSISKLEPSVACIGYFDGVHLGHQELIKKTIDEACKLGIKSSLICFDPDPLNIINKTKNKHILSFKNRKNLISYFGIEDIIVIKFSEEIMNMSPTKFINDYLNKLNIVKLVCGYDFSFGRNAMGSYDLLKKIGKFETIVIPELKLYSKKVSSSRIKNEIEKGNFKLVNKLLGYNYAIEVKVIEWKKINSKYELKTKPIDAECLLPNNGEYGVGLRVENNFVYVLGNAKLPNNQRLVLEFNQYE